MGLIVLLILLMMTLVGCHRDNNAFRTIRSLPDPDTVFLETASELREIAWNELTEKEKATVIGDWKEAPVTIMKWDNVPKQIKKKYLEPAPIYKVTFHTNLDSLLGPIGIYYDPAVKKIVGYDVRG